MLYEHKIQYYETDQMQVVHHSNYIRWFEEARSELLGTYNVGYDHLEKMGIICPIMSVQAKYKSMSRYPEVVQIKVSVMEYNGVKCIMSFMVRDKMTGEIRCIGESKHCFIDEQGRAISLKRNYPEIHQVFEKIKEENK